VVPSGACIHANAEDGTFVIKTQRDLLLFEGTSGRRRTSTWPAV
jgi:hypothetical protein